MDTRKIFLKWNKAESYSPSRQVNLKKRKTNTKTYKPVDGKNSFQNPKFVGISKDSASLRHRRKKIKNAEGKGYTSFVPWVQERWDSWERKIALRNMSGDPGRNHGLLKASLVWWFQETTYKAGWLTPDAHSGVVGGNHYDEEKSQKCPFGLKEYKPLFPSGQNRRLQGAPELLWEIRRANGEQQGHGRAHSHFLSLVL